jgi:DNA (cytosine-5)-methyltransferase 1
VVKYLSVCSGIEAATVAWHTLGWKPAGFAEIEKFPSEVLKHHYSTVQNYGDMTKFKEWNVEPGTIDLLVGGTPCQSFSVAGLRKGLSDPRGNLMLTYGAIADYFKPTWIVWENVPGVLSSNHGRDFGTFLGMLGQLGYGFAYRVLDAQYFGVAQRRRRVFVVGYLGDWRRSAAVLFESESLCGNPAPSREAGKGFARNVAFGVGESSELAHCLRSVASKADKHESSTYVCMAHGQANAEIRQDGGSPDLTCNHEAPIVSYGIPGNWIGRKPENGGNAVEPMHNVAPCLTKTDRHGVACLMDQGGSVMNVEYDRTGTLRRETKGHEPIVFPAVRRLTPIECERLQGFPDNYTNIKPSCPDGPRYKALGNSMAVPVMRWIGERIKNVCFYPAV